MGGGGGGDFPVGLAAGGACLGGDWVGFGASFPLGAYLDGAFGAYFPFGAYLVAAFGSTFWVAAGCWLGAV